MVIGTSCSGARRSGTGRAAGDVTAPRPPRTAARPIILSSIPCYYLPCFAHDHFPPFPLTPAFSLGIVSVSDSQRLASTFYTAAVRGGGGVATMNFNATPGGASSLVFGSPPPSIQWSQEIMPFSSKAGEEFHASVFDLSVCGVNIMGGGGSQYPALIDTGALLNPPSTHALL